MAPEKNESAEILFNLIRTRVDGGVPDYRRNAQQQQKF